MTDAWHVDYRTVPGGSIASGSITLLDPSQPASRALFDYTRAVLPALGIENGAAHSEAADDAASPALIETGARLMGGSMEAASYRAAGLPTQASRYADALLMRVEDSRHAARMGDYAFKRAARESVLHLRSRRPSADTDGLAKLRRLPSFHAHYGRARRASGCGERPTRCFGGGVVYLVHEAQAQIEADIRQFREWDAPASSIRSRPPWRKRR